MFPPSEPQMQFAVNVFFYGTVLLALGMMGDAAINWIFSQ